MGGQWPWAAQELETCAGFLVQHGLHLTALELAQELQEVHKMPAQDCRVLDDFLAQLPVAVAGESEAGDDSRTLTKSSSLEDSPVPLGAVEREARVAEERAALLEYELRLCRADLHDEVRRLHCLFECADNDEQLTSTDGTLPGLQLRAAVRRGRAVQTCVAEVADAGTTTDDLCLESVILHSAHADEEAVASPVETSTAVTQEEVPLQDGSEATAHLAAPEDAKVAAALPSVLPSAEILKDAVVKLGSAAEQADFVAAVAATVLELAQNMKPVERVALVPLLVRCALLQPDATGLLIARLLPWLLSDELPTQTSADASSPTGCKSPGLCAKSSSSGSSGRREVLQGLISIAAQLMPSFSTAALPSIFQYFQSKHVARRSLVAQLCGVWDIIFKPEANRSENDEHKSASGSHAIFPVLLALTQDTNEEVRAVSAAALIRRFRHGLCWEEAMSSKELATLHMLMSDHHPLVLATCRHLLVPEVYRRFQLSSSSTDLREQWKAQRLQFGPVAAEVARLAAHRLSGSPLTTSEYGVCLLRLRLALDMLLAFLPAAVMDVADVYKEKDADSESPEEYMQMPMLDFAPGWEGGWCCDATAAALLVVHDDRALEASLSCSGEDAANQRECLPPAATRLLAQTLRQRCEDDFRKHVRPDGRLPFDWSENWPRMARSAGSEDLCASKSAAERADAAIETSLPVPDEKASDSSAPVPRVLPSPLDLLSKSGHDEEAPCDSDSIADATTEGALSDERRRQQLLAPSRDAEDESDSEFSIASEFREDAGGKQQAKDRDIGVVRVAGGVAQQAASSLSSLWQQLPAKEVLATQLGSVHEAVKKELSKELARASAKTAGQNMREQPVSHFTPAQVQGLDDFLGVPSTSSSSTAKVPVVHAVAFLEPGGSPQSPSNEVRNTPLSATSPRHPAAEDAAAAVQSPAMMPPLPPAPAGDLGEVPDAVAFCINGWVTAAADVAAQLDWCHPGHSHVFEALCCGLEALVHIFGPKFRSSVIGPQLLRAGSKALGVEETQDEIGLYRIEYHGVPVVPIAYDPLVPTSQGRFIYLSAGMSVNVVELAHREDLQRLQGRIENPPGWISLKSLDSKYRWAVPVAGQVVSSAKSVDPIADPTLPVFCRIVVQHLPPESTVKWLVEKTLKHARSSGSRQRERWLWQSVAARPDATLREQLLTNAIWPAVSGEFGLQGQAVAAHALDVLAMVYGPLELERLVLPALFALADLACQFRVDDVDSKDLSVCEAQVAIGSGAIDALGRTWSRMQELSDAAVEKITLHFRDVTVNSTSRIAEAGAVALGRVTVSSFHRQTLFSALEAAFHLVFAEEHVQAPNVQAELARTLVALASHEALTQDGGACTKMRKMSAALQQRSPLAEVHVFQKLPVGLDPPQGWRLASPMEVDAHLGDVVRLLQKVDVVAVTEGYVILGELALEIEDGGHSTFNQICASDCPDSQWTHVLLCSIQPPSRADITVSLKRVIANLGASGVRVLRQ